MAQGSASQIKRWKACQRAWGWDYIVEIPREEKAATELGKAVHAQLESYLAGTGTFDFTTEVGYIAASGIEHLPKPGTPGMQLETEFHFFGPSGNSYLGYIDVEIEPTKFTVGEIIDHKTTSDFRWRKTPEELREDEQAVLYAANFFRKYPDAVFVDLRWIYYLTRGSRRSSEIKVRVEQGQIFREFLKLEETMKEIAGARDRAAGAEDKEAWVKEQLPPNVEHCSAFGGCQHQGRCNLSPMDRFRAHARQEVVQLRRPKMDDLMSSLMGSTKPAATNGAPPPAASPPSLLKEMKSAGAPAATVHTGVNPPEFQPELPLEAEEKGGAAPETAEAVNAGEKKGGGKKGAGRPRTKVPAIDDLAGFAAANPDVNVNLLTPEQADILNALSKTKQPLTWNESILGPKPAAPTPSPTRQEVAAKQTELLAGRPNPFQETTKPAVKPVEGKNIHVLYVNCGPVGVPVTDANAFIVEAKKLILKEKGLADYRFADYGHGPGMLAVAVAHLVDQRNEAWDEVRVDTDTPEGSIILSELLARAALIVR
jgi:hypothetical protein